MANSCDLYIFYCKFGFRYPCTNFQACGVVDFLQNASCTVMDLTDYSYVPRATATDMAICLQVAQVRLHDFM